jgi:hypothetical protein
LPSSHAPMPWFRHRGVGPPRFPQLQLLRP